MSRVFEHARTWRLTAAAFAAAADLIAGAERAHDPGLVIGIQRGGRPLALALAARLGVPAVMVTARHNPGDQVAVQATGRVAVSAGGLLACPPAARVLVADDICGTGATLRAVTGLAAALLGATARTAVLCRNSGSGLAPSTWVWDVSDWVCFPWEAPPPPGAENLPLPRNVRHP